MREELQRALWPKGPNPNIWAIVDTAQDQKVYWTLTNSFLNYSCLFAGRLPPALEMAAPYLVQLDPDDKFTHFLADNMGRNLGIFLQCDTSLKELRKHLRTFLTVKNIHGVRMLFRYYDPRVMRVYLPTCTSTELDAVFGPIKSIWTEGGNYGEMTQFSRKGRELLSAPLTLGGAAIVEDTAEAAIVPGQKAFVLPHGATGRQRLPLLLQGAGKGARLRVTKGDLRIFRTAVAAEEMAQALGAYVIPATTLDPDVTVYAETSAPGESSLHLELSQGGRAETTVTAVRLSLDTGSPEVGVGVRGNYGTRRRRIDVLPPVPASFEGRLTLRTTAAGPELTLFASATETFGVSLRDGYSFDAPKEPVSFWIESAAASARAGDVTLQLLVEGSTAVGDARPVTAMEVVPLVTLPSVVVTGSIGGANPLPLKAETKPAGVPLTWHAVRAHDDGAAIQAVSPRPLPTITPDSGLLADAAGTFLIRATTGGPGDWGGPGAELEITIVHAAIGDNETAIKGRFCACAREAGTDRFRLHSGKEPAVQLNASVVLTGGGPDGARGLGAIRACWINNIVSDNGGARYKGGRESRIVIEDGPRLDAPSAQTPCMSGHAPGAPLAETAGEPVWVRAEAAPELSRPVQDGGAIEQIWRYLECRSHLALWSTDAPENVAVLLHTGWSFTGDYTCNPTKTLKTIVPARLAASGTTEYPAPVPASQASLELKHPL